MSATGVKLPLNAGQQVAADGLFEFLLSDETEMAIKGPAGTGKTLLLGHLIDDIMIRYRQTCIDTKQPVRYENVVITAMTNPAAEKVGIAMGREASTIYSFMNLRVQDDWETGVSKIIKTHNWRVWENFIIIIDEAYTMDSRTLSLIHEGTHNCKIIYVGDHCQLGPVKESVCPLLKINMRTYELTQPMRNAGQPALMDLCNQLRATVETGIFKPIKVEPGVIDHLGDVDMEQAIHDHFISKQTEDRIAAYTNSRVIAYNDHVRLLRQLPVDYGVGEYLINNMAYSQGRSRISIEEEIEILDQSKDVVHYPIDSGVELAIRYTKIRTSKGLILNNVPIPLDRDHYKNLKAYYQSIKKWPTYFMLKDTFPDFRPKDAATFHKLQGSTCDTIFIDVGDLSRTCRRPDLASRLLYVGGSRARRRVVFYGTLADKYGGITT